MKHNLDKETRMMLFWMAFITGGLISYKLGSFLLGIATFLILTFIEILIDNFDLTNNKDEKDKS